MFTLPTSKKEPHLRIIQRHEAYRLKNRYRIHAHSSKIIQKFRYEKRTKKCRDYNSISFVSSSEKSEMVLSVSE